MTGRPSARRAVPPPSGPRSPTDEEVVVALRRLADGLRVTEWERACLELALDTLAAPSTPSRRWLEPSDEEAAE